ncbi:MAG: GAF domain-containing protein [Acidobacteria bacterium]|nr:GAF domain-containing protein [Acidobacteriota bacterium]
MSDLLNKLFSSPLALGILIGAAVLLILLVGFLLVRFRRGGREEEKVRSQLAAMERETQFAGAVEQVPYQAAPEACAAQLATVFKDYLAMPVFKIYAGHESDQEFVNVLPKEQAGAYVTNDLAITATLPPTIPANAALGFSRPQLINTNALLTQPPAVPGQSVTALPWRGAFGWSGMIIANVMNTNPAEALANFQPSIAHLCNRLAVALELASQQTDHVDVEQKVSRSEQFYQAVLAALEEEAPLPAILREVTALLGSDSSAMWLLDGASQMLRLDASYGLRSTEFLPLPLGQGLAGSIVESGNPLALEDAPADPRCIFPREARESGVGSYLGVPILSNGVAIGALEVHTVKSKWWSDADAATLLSAASALASVMQNSKLRGNKLRVENAYLGLAEALQRLRTPEDLKAAVVEVLGHALGVSRATVVDFDAHTGAVSMRHEFKRQNIKSALGATFKGTALQEMLQTSTDGEPVAIRDSEAHSLIDRELAKALHILSELAIPVKIEGQIRALIYLHQCDRVRVWQPSEIEFADRVGRQLSLSLANVTALNEALQSAEAARDAAKVAADSMNRAQTIINALPEAVLGLDKEGHLTFVNNMARHWLSLKQEDLGKMANWIDRLAMADPMFWSRVIAAKTVTKLESRLKANPTVGQTLTEALILDNDDSQPVYVAVAPLKGSMGEANGFLVVISDRGQLSNEDGRYAPRFDALKEQQAELERRLTEMRAAELQARARIEKLNSLEASLRDNAAKSGDAAMLQERERLKQELAKVQSQLQQLLTAYQLKSEFIVNCGSEMAATIHTTIGMAEMLEKGIYGQLNDSQRQAVGELLGKARSLKGDLGSLVEYGSSRPR